MLATDGFLGRRLTRRELVVDGDTNGRQLKSVLSDAVKELDDECGVRVRGQRSGAAVVVGSRDVVVGGTARGAAGQQLLGQPPEVLDERELQHARPRPQLANRQRRDTLIAVQELDQLLAIQPAVAVTDQFDGDRVDAGVTGVLTGGERGQRARVRAR